jgi:hypothetical protein
LEVFGGKEREEARAKCQGDQTEPSLLPRFLSHASSGGVPGCLLLRRFLVPRGRANKATAPDESISNFFLRLRTVCLFVATLLFFEKKVPHSPIFGTAALTLLRCSRKQPLLVLLAPRRDQKSKTRIDLGGWLKTLETCLQSRRSMCPGFWEER